MRRHLFAFWILAALGQPAVAQVSDSEIEACRDAPDAACLADIGSALAFDTGAARFRLSGANLLAQLGRVDEAHELELRFHMAEGLSRDRALWQADFLVAPYRVMAALRNGDDPETATAATDAGGLGLRLAIAQLAGMQATNTMLPLHPATDEATRAILRRILPDYGTKRYERLWAAEMLAYVGEGEAARAILDDLPVDDTPRTNLSEVLVDLVGTDRAL